VLALQPEPAAGSATRVYVAPITHSVPQESAAAVEIPRAIKKHLRLDEERSWIIVSELNAFAWPGYDLRQIPGSQSEYAYGVLPPRFFIEVLERFNALRKRRRLQATPR
jgi:hypothetical protein